MMDLSHRRANPPPSTGISDANPTTRDDAQTRVLERGDLVRVLERRGSKKRKDRHGGLGRVHRAIPLAQEDLPTSDNTSSSPHPYRYEVDWVLGGRIFNVPRWELCLTTAEAEGLTESKKRKRKPSRPHPPSPEASRQKAKSKSSGKQKSQAATTKRNAGKKLAKKDSRKETSKKSSKMAKADRKGGSTSNDSDLEAKPSNALDMYERHRNEFERSLIRLEKLDVFGFFLGEPLPGYDEFYDEANAEDSNDEGSIDSGQAERKKMVDPTMKVSTGEGGTTDQKGPKAVIFPSHPPFNWTVIRKRMDHGRYVRDMVKMEEEEYRKRCLATVGAGDTTQNISHEFRVKYPEGVHWDLFRSDVIAMCDAAIQRDPSGTSGGTGTLGHTASKIKDVMEQIYCRIGHRQLAEMSEANTLHKFVMAAEAAGGNNEPAMQGTWRKNAFPERRYERLSSSNVVCAGLSSLDERSAIFEQETSLPDSFVGLSYKYDDTGMSEGWMKSVVDDTANRRKRKKKTEENVEEQRAALALAADDGVVRAQVRTTMNLLLISVQDKVMTDLGILKHAEMRSANWEDRDDLPSQNKDQKQVNADLVQKDSTSDKDVDPEVAEQAVWGIDCYTRKNVEFCLETYFDSRIATDFIEKWLLPAINSCPVDVAHDIACAARVLEGMPLSNDMEEKTTQPQQCSASAASATKSSGSHVHLSQALAKKINSSGPPWLKSVAHQLRIAAEGLGESWFRVHPKGNGCVVIRKEGLPANTLVTYYRGEVYPPWRWGEKLDAIEQTQKRLGLRPNLPDFYNMALERPRVDPRGFGLNVVDASRKAGLGSSFSHSCEPTCEVKVVAKNGKLSLAMVTLREIDCGEELTFDYNAVTESLHEYHYAICLCGHKRCRGSFLHFATADCYQQVLNRNAPIAVRFSNLVKGSTKKVMSREDETVLENHGFGTAAFGAVSLNYHRENKDKPIDSLEYIPIWLRTFVADTLRYIEYERRALPIALLCNLFSKRDSAKTLKSPQTQERTKTKEENRKLVQNIQGNESVSAEENSRPVPGSKPENTFLYFSRKQRDSFVKILNEQGVTDLKGLSLNKAIQKVAGTTWKNLSDEMKQYWKDMVVSEWEMNGGRRKAMLEQERKARVREGATETSAEVRGKPSESKKRKHDGEGKVPKAKSLRSKKDGPVEVHAHQISFEAADAEGWSAMEQRIHQLTQTLSRVGRVLDRHRENSFESSSMRRSAASAEFLRGQLHSPLMVMPDEAVVGWLFNHPEGITQTLLQLSKEEPWASSPLPERLAKVTKKHMALLEGVDATLAPAEARLACTEALLELRDSVLETMNEMDADAQRHRDARSRLKAKKRREERKLRKEAKNFEAKAEYEVPGLKHGGDSSPVGHNGPDFKLEEASGLLATPSLTISTKPAMDVLESADTRTTSGVSSCCQEESETRTNGVNGSLAPLWSTQIAQKHKLEAAADLLLMYAHTSNFFCLNPYCSFQSSPVEVYARELGNAVPRSVVENADAWEKKTKGGCAEKSSFECVDNEEVEVPKRAVTVRRGKGCGSCANCRREDDCGKCVCCLDKRKFGGKNIRKQKCKLRRCLENKGNRHLPDKTDIDQNDLCSNECASSLHKEQDSNDQRVELCEPDDVITSVTVNYSGEYVLSSLLQWYTGGIGLKPGLPDMTGCIMLPLLKGWWKDGMQSGITEPYEKRNGVTRTRYEAEIRPKLVEWFEDRYQRGSPWPEEVKDFFISPNRKDPSDGFRPPMGSPVLDLLVTGDETNLQRVLQSLRCQGIHDVAFGDNVPKVSKRKKTKKSATERLQSSVDEGMPQNVAVANWVQCENPHCMKWRKLPWHVDIEVDLPDHFFCKDNIWDPSSNSCSAEEADWDVNDAPVKFSDTANNNPGKTDAKVRAGNLEVATKDVSHDLPKKASKKKKARKKDMVDVRTDISMVGSEAVSTTHGKIRKKKKNILKGPSVDTSTGTSNSRSDARKAQSKNQTGTPPLNCDARTAEEDSFEGTKRQNKRETLSMDKSLSAITHQKSRYSQHPDEPSSKKQQCEEARNQQAAFLPPGSNRTAPPINQHLEAVSAKTSPTKAVNCCKELPRSFKKDRALLSRGQTLPDSGFDGWQEVSKYSDPALQGQKEETKQHGDKTAGRAKITQQGNGVSVAEAFIPPVQTHADMPVQKETCQGLASLSKVCAIAELMESKSPISTKERTAKKPPGDAEFRYGETEDLFTRPSGAPTEEQSSHHSNVPYTTNQSQGWNEPRKEHEYFPPPHQFHSAPSQQTTHYQRVESSHQLNRSAASQNMETNQADSNGLVSHPTSASRFAPRRVFNPHFPRQDMGYTQGTGVFRQGQNHSASPLCASNQFHDSNVQFRHQSNTNTTISHQAGVAHEMRPSFPHHMANNNARQQVGYSAAPDFQPPPQMCAPYPSQVTGNAPGSNHAQGSIPWQPYPRRS